MAWIYMAVAILTELIGTLLLRQVSGSPSWWAGALVAVSYAVSFATLALALRQLNVGVVYAIWSGVGTAAVTIAGVLLFGEHLNWQGVVGMLLIVGGVMVLVSSGSVRHS